MEQLKYFFSLNPRKSLMQIVNLLFIVSSALAFWRFLVTITFSESPLVVVLSGSMEPSYQRGDVLFLSNWGEPVVPGDIVVYQDVIHDIPIVHRVLDVQTEVDKNGKEKVKLLTKGDNNSIHDRGLYQRGDHWLRKELLLGRVRANFPYVGYATILLNDYPALKYLMLLALGISVLGSRDPQG